MCVMSIVMCVMSIVMCVMSIPKLNFLAVAVFLTMGKNVIYRITKKAD